MDNIGSSQSGHLLSRQVTDPRYFFLDWAAAGPSAAVKLTFGGRERCHPDYRISRRHFGYHGLEYVAAGQGWVILNGKRTELRSGSIFAYSPGMHCEMGTVAADPMVKYFFCFAGRAPDSRLRRAQLAAGMVRTLFNPVEIQTIAEDLIREGQRTSLLTSEICGTLFDLLLLKLTDTTDEVEDQSEPARRNFLRCKALIDGEVTRLRTLDEIARRVSLEKSSVCRLFRRFHGTSPYQYLLRQKMNRAAETLLQQGGLVKEVAAQMGFSDPFHFSRSFKAVHGKSPSRLRGAHRRLEMRTEGGK